MLLAVIRMGHEAFGVDLAALKQAEQGVHDALATLAAMKGWGGSSIGSANAGFIDEDLRQAAGKAGSPVLADALDEFGEAWETGVRHLVKEGEACAGALRDTRSTYEKAEEKAHDAFKYALHTQLGDPMEDHGAWKDKGAGQILGELAPNPAGMIESTNSTTQQFGSVYDTITGNDNTIVRPGGGH